jgi:hypothetical protein
MTRRVFLHVGSPKTGTTFLQQVLWSQQAVARDQGLLLPLRNLFDHYLASLDIRGLSGLKQHPPRAVGIWKALVHEAAEWPGDVLVSHELFAAATAEQAEAAIASLSHAEVHVVLTVRDLVRQIPAEWQEHVKHRSVQPFERFIARVEQQDPGDWFWQVQDYPAVASRWGRSLPGSRVHIVTVPPRGSPPAILWRRFAGLVGLDADAFDLTAPRANESLGMEQAELLRRLNERLGDRLPMPGPYPNVVKEIFAHQVLAGLPGTRLALPPPAREFALRRGREMVDELVSLSVDVVGDLSDLVPDTAADEAAADGEPDTVTDRELLDQSIEALAGVLTWYHRHRGTMAAKPLRKLMSDMRHRPLRELAIALSLRWRWLMTIRVGYWRAVNAARSLPFLRSRG